MLTKARYGQSFTMGLFQSHEVRIEIVDVYEYLDSIHSGTCLIFIDPVVLANQSPLLELERNKDVVFLIPTSIHEANKDADSLFAILNIFESYTISRRGDKVIAIGGGALLDTVSLAASIYRRGIHVDKIPTTLLGIVDASIGIKTGINYLGQRNRIGSYHFNYDVRIDPQLLAGLNSTQLRQGLGEIIKIAIIKSENLFFKLVKYKADLQQPEFYSTPPGIDIIMLSIELMLEELHDNPTESNLMRCVDFGHSFSPLVEMQSISKTEARPLAHGFAVAYDCAISTCIAKKRNLICNQDFRLIMELLSYFDFDFSNPIYDDHNLIWSSFLEMTRHRAGNQNLPVPTAIGKHTFIQDLTLTELIQTLEYMSDNA